MSSLSPDKNSLVRITELRFGNAIGKDLHIEALSRRNDTESLQGMSGLAIDEKELVGFLPPLFVFLKQTEFMDFTDDAATSSWKFIVARRSASFIRWAMADDGLYLYQNVADISPSELPEQYRKEIDGLARHVLSNVGLAALSTK